MLIYQGSNGCVYCTEVTTQGLQTPPHTPTDVLVHLPSSHCGFSAHTGPNVFFFFCEEGRSLLYLSWFRTCSVKSSSLCKCYFVIALCGHVPGCQVWVVTPQQGKRHCSSFRPHLDAQRVFSPVVFVFCFFGRERKKKSWIQMPYLS